MLDTLFTSIIISLKNRRDPLCNKLVLTVAELIPKDIINDIDHIITFPMASVILERDISAEALVVMLTKTDNIDIYRLYEAQLPPTIDMTSFYKNCLDEAIRFGNVKIIKYLVTKNEKNTSYLLDAQCRRVGKILTQAYDYSNIELFSVVTDRRSDSTVIPNLLEFLVGRGFKSTCSIHELDNLVERVKHNPDYMQPILNILDGDDGTKFLNTSVRMYYHYHLPLLTMKILVSRGCSIVPTRHTLLYCTPHHLGILINHGLPVSDEVLIYSACHYDADLRKMDKVQTTYQAYNLCN